MKKISFKRSYIFTAVFALLFLVIASSSFIAKSSNVASFPAKAFADGSVPWVGNGSDAGLCTGQYAGYNHWIFTTGGNSSVTSATLTVNGAGGYSMTQNGNGSWSVYVLGGLPSSASVAYVGDLGNGNAVLTISCLGAPVPTPTPTGSPTPTPTGSPTPTPTCSPTPTPTGSPTPTPEYHYACNDDFICVKEEGPGPSTCETNADCQQQPTPTPTPTPQPTPIPTSTSTPGSNNGGGGGGGGGGGSNPPVCSDQKPNTPSNVIAVAGPGAGQVTLSWTAPQGPVSDYSITYSDSPDTKKWGVASTGNVTSYTISGLSVNKYYFWVNAVNGCMPGDPVGPVSVGGTGGPAVLGASTGPGVLGLSYTSGDSNALLVFSQLFAAFILSTAGFIFFKKNA